MKIRTRIAAILGTAVLSAGIAGTAFAATSNDQAAKTASPSNIYGCVTTGRALTGVYTVPGNFPGCKTGFPVTVDSGTTSAPVNPVTSQVFNLGAIATVNTGGSFSSRATAVGTVKLSAGTYMVTVNAEATPLGDAVEVFPQIMVYDGAPLPTWANDLFNVGSGALAEDSTTVNSYYSGTDIVTVPAAGETLNVLAFGYDNDQSAGEYALNDLIVTAVKL